MVIDDLKLKATKTSNVVSMLKALKIDDTKVSFFYQKIMIKIFI